MALRVENRDWANWRERWAAGDLPRLTIPRPGHADYAGMVKYGLDDTRPVLERASARETAARVAAGALEQDAAQRAVLPEFDRIAAALDAPEPRRLGGIFAKKPEPVTKPKGPEVEEPAPQPEGPQGQQPEGKVKAKGK